MQLLPTDPIDFSAALLRCNSIAASVELFGATIKPYGFDIFSSGEVDINDRDLTLFTVVAWPEPVQKFYFDNKLYENDPVIETLRRRDTSFTWEDMRADRALGEFGTKNLRMLAEFGYVAGLVVPFPHGKSRFGLVSLVGKHANRTKRDYEFLELISTCLYHRVRHLAPRMGFSMPPLGLSQRQLESMQFVARGLSDREIAQKLSISTSTAHEFDLDFNCARICRNRKT